MSPKILNSGDIDLDLQSKIGLQTSKKINLFEFYVLTLTVH